MELFRSHLQKYLTDKEIDNLISSFDNKPFGGLLLNTNKMGENELLALYPNMKPHPLVKNGFIYDKEEYFPGKSIYHELGCFYLQEPSAMIVSSLLPINEGDLILDLCAAPGGKSIGAGLTLNGTGLLISNDLANDRAHILKENISRMGLTNTIVTNNDFSFIYDKFLSTFDKIILDAPCSGSGMFRKEEKMKDDWSINKVYKNAMIQMGLIDMSYQMLKPGGILIYSTCSYSYEEDEAIIKHLLENSDATLINIKDSKYFYKSKENIGVHLFPSLFTGEGHYICLIKKPGEAKPTKYIKGNYSLELESGKVSKFNSSIFNKDLLAIPNLIYYKKLYILKYGFKVGTVFNKETVYDYEYAHTCKSYKNNIDLSLDEVKKYLLGEELNIKNNYKGNVLLTYQNIPIDFGKTNGIVIKNHYPKNLRKKVL